jgi:ribonuclease Y
MWPHLTGMKASELGLDVREAKRAGLLHDIGKAVDHKLEGTHAELGADYAKRFGEHERIVEAICDPPRRRPQQQISWAFLVQVADPFGGPPGRRREMLETP